VHNPEDSRIRQRQINALINAGWEITYAAPFRAFGRDVPAAHHAGPDRGGLRCIDIPRSSGRRRFRAWRAARAILQASADEHDVLCLLRNLPNYQVSLPTKIVEYCALGVPVIATPLPLAAELVRSEKVGLEVPWDDPSSVVDAILTLRADPLLRREMGCNGHRVALRDHDWNRQSSDFVHIMEAIAERVRAEA
jgi:hypothetical protein